MKTLIFATGNAHKTQEVRAILKDLPLEIKSLKEAGIDVEIVEDGTSFEENALIKARTVYAATGLPVLADDSGIEIDALDGAPGVYSARFLGEDTPYTEKNATILETLKPIPEELRGADFRCVMAAVLPMKKDGVTEAREITEEGRIDGRIAHAPAGENGFGYDPIFYLPDRGCTSAELSPEEKNAISHRGLALEAMKKHLQAWLLEEDV